MQTKISQKPEKRRHQYQNGRDTIVREVTPFLDTISQTVTVRYDISVNRNGKIIKQIQENYVMRFMFIRKWPFSCNRQVWSWSIAAHFLKQHSKKGVFTGCHSRLDLTIVTPINTNPLFKTFNQKNSSMLCIGVNKIKINFDTSQLCCGVVHYLESHAGRDLNVTFSIYSSSFRSTLIFLASTLDIPIVWWWTDLFLIFKFSFNH